MTPSSLKDKILLLFATFVLWALVFVLQKPVFLLLYAGGLAQAFPVMWHGLPLDLSIAGYFSTVPASLLLLSSVPIRSFHTTKSEHRFAIVIRLWILTAAIVTALSFVANLALYDYWRFPLDSTPIFFLTSSPKDALASILWWQGLLAIVSVVGLVFLYILIFRLLIRLFEPQVWHAIHPVGMLLMLLVVGTLILPIRGGFTVATMNTGQVYYSENQTLNHAAVNPLFSFIENLTLQKDFSKQYRYMDDDDAHSIVQPMLYTKSDSNQTRALIEKRPDIYLVILEGFSDTLMRTPNVTPNLIRLRDQGVWFSKFYANSFRTDRGLVSILLGYPSPATVSLMKFPKKTASVPSMATALQRAGWQLKYYYGGDADFTNMRSFLVNQGFHNIVEDVSFPVSDRLGKWGVPDHLLFRRVEKDLKQNQNTDPRLCVIQTSSSHEPFDVPYHHLASKSLNAFAYADSCVGGFVNYLKATGRWSRSLVILVPDHLGAWPENIDNFKPWRFHIPMIWTGGAVRGPMVVQTYGSQQDIAATLLGQVDIPHSDMRFSKDIFNVSSPHFAFFMMNDGFGLIDEDNAVIYDHKRKQAVLDKGSRQGRNIVRGKAYTQYLFDDFAAR